MRAMRGAMREMRAEETADASSAEGRERAFQQAEGETAGEERMERMKFGGRDTLNTKRLVSSVQGRCK